MAENPVFSFNGMNNKAKPQNLGLDKLSHAENVQFTNDNELVIPGQEFTTTYSVGSVNSVNSSANGILYSNGTNLYKYAVSPVAIKSTVGSNAFSYTRPIGTTLYFSNGTVTGKFVKGESTAREWGTPTPTSAPTVTPTTVGGLTAGIYRVAITWIADEESGAKISVQATVVEGGGITISNLPTPPAYVTKVGIYCSQCNGKDLYLYSEINANVTSTTISDFKGTIKLDTQFCSPPAPAVNAPLVDHYGRIYWGDGSLLRYTMLGLYGPRYGLSQPFDYIPFDSEIQTIVSCPGVLYVGTLYNLYKITNIDAPDESPKVIEPLQGCGSVKGSECYDPDGISGYFMSHRGFIKATPEGLEELSYDSVALPLYTAGSMTVTEYDGLKYLFFSGSGGTVNPLALDSWNDSETFPHTSGWAINLTTGAVSKYAFTSINRLHNGYSSGSSGIGAIGTGSVSVGLVRSGEYDFGTTLKKRIPHAYLEMDGDSLKFTASTDNSTVTYKTDSTSALSTVKVDGMARGALGRFWQFTLTNLTLKSALVSSIELMVIPASRRK